MNDSLATSKSKSWSWSGILVILGIALFTNCYLLGTGPLAGTEGHRALAAHQMVTAGQWLIPHLYDQVYLRKPPLQYWIAGALEKITGQASPWVWRMPSAVAGALTAVVIYLMTARWYGRFAGWFAGISCCGLLTLWGQNRTGEIDALNTTACVTCTCLLLDLDWGKPRTKFWPMLGAAIAFAAAMMTKGPAGLAPIVGALFGPAVLNHTNRALKSPWPWIAIALGCVPAGIYALAVSLQFHAQQAQADTSGLLEIIQNFIYDRRKNIPESFELPLNLFLYCMPVSIFLPMAFLPKLWRPAHATEKWTESDCRLLRGLMGVLLISFVITEIFGLVHPRYSYLWLPLICPIAGAVAAAWERGGLADGGRQADVSQAASTAHANGRVLQYATPKGWWHHRFIEALVLSVIVLGIGAIVLTIISHRQHAPMLVVSIASAAAAVVVGIVTIHLLAKDLVIPAGWGFIAIILLIGVIYGPWGITDRQRRATTLGSQYLASHFPPGTTFTTGDLLFEQPELFYYANVNVESYPYTFLHPMSFPTGRWLIMEPEELSSWNTRAPGLLKDAKNINPVGPEVWMAWYEAK